MVIYIYRHIQQFLFSTMLLFRSIRPSAGTNVHDVKACEMRHKYVGICENSSLLLLSLHSNVRYCISCMFLFFKPRCIISY